MNKSKNIKGITLIALVIIIIGLIVLTGVSLNVLMGDNGILKKEKSLDIQHLIVEKKKVVTLALHTEFLDNDGDISKVKVEGLLEEIRNSQKTNVIYCLKDINGVESKINTTVGNTPLGCKVVFPKEITGTAKKQITILVDEYGNVTGTSGDEDTLKLSSTKYTITYDKNDEKASGTMKDTTGGAPKVATNEFTAPDGKKFKEWNSSSDGLGTRYEVGTILNKNIKLYAIWKNEEEVVYGLGDEVQVQITIPGKKEGEDDIITQEHFYVISTDDDATKTTVTLLATYNLDIIPSTGGHYYQKKDATYSQTVTVFSDKTYWGSFSSSSSQTKKDLNEYTTSNIITSKNLTVYNNAILRARDYALAVGGTSGRLLTLDEVQKLINNENNVEMNKIINGKGNFLDFAANIQYGLFYWLASAYDTNYIYAISPGSDASKDVTFNVISKATDARARS